MLFLHIWYFHKLQMVNGHLGLEDWETGAEDLK